MSDHRDIVRRGWRKAKAESDTPNRPKLSWKDYVTLGFSAVALALSVVGAYFNFFRDETRVLGAVVGPTPNQVFTQTHAPTDKVDVAVMNTGNRQVAVTGGRVYVSWLTTKFVLNPAAGTTTFPVLIEPGSMAVIAFVTNPTAQLTQNVSKPGQTDAINVVFSVELTAIGATGERIATSINALEASFNGAFFSDLVFGSREPVLFK